MHAPQNLHILIALIRTSLMHNEIKEPWQPIKHA